MESILPPPLPRRLDPETCVGITTTVPVEVIYAAGLTPIDLNNVFVADPDPEGLVDEAECAGFPRTCCCWTKGIYAAVKRLGLRTVVGVVQGDCSNTHGLMEVLAYEGVKCIPFDYPHRPDPAKMRRAVEQFADALGATADEAEAWRERLRQPRALATEIDRLSREEARVGGLENHLWLVSCSDFCGAPERYGEAADAFLRAARGRENIPHVVRLGCVGVPPISPAIYDFLESEGALVLFNETQRQFAMPAGGASLAEQYSRYTYPYGIAGRLEDIRQQIAERRLDGVVHYVQSFCFRRIEDRLLREQLPVPVLTIECDRPGPLSGQVKTRLEAFAQTLRARKSGHRLL